MLVAYTHFEDKTGCSVQSRKKVIQCFYKIPFRNNLPMRVWVTPFREPLQDLFKSHGIYLFYFILFVFKNYGILEESMSFKCFIDRTEWWQHQNCWWFVWCYELFEPFKCAIRNPGIWKCDEKTRTPRIIEWITYNMMTIKASSSSEVYESMILGMMVWTMGEM